MTSLTRALTLVQHPIRRAKLHELVTERLEEMMRTGELKPGDRLPSERDLMVAFSIGRPAVREALLTLHSKGLIVTENGRRASVRTPTTDDVLTTLNSVVGVAISNRESLKHLFDARTFIEAAMARNAAVNITDRSLADLKEALEANRRAIGDRDLFVQTDVQFHQILFRVVKNPVFEAVDRALSHWLKERWARIQRNSKSESLAHQGHAQVYKAISRRDPDAAEKAMRKHLNSSWAYWTRQLNEMRA